LNQDLVSRFGYGFRIWILIFLMFLVSGYKLLMLVLDSASESRFYILGLDSESVSDLWLSICILFEILDMNSESLFPIWIVDLDFRFWIQDSRFWILDLNLDSRSRFKIWILDLNFTTDENR
jgi:hypothetical protein